MFQHVIGEFFFFPLRCRVFSLRISPQIFFMLFLFSVHVRSAVPLLPLV